MRHSNRCLLKLQIVLLKSLSSKNHNQTNAFKQTSFSNALNNKLKRKEIISLIYLFYNRVEQRRKLQYTALQSQFQSLYTPCLSTPAESTPESSPVKMRPTKPVSGEKGLDFLPPRCVLVIWVSPREILNLLMFLSNFLKFWYLPGDIAETVIFPWSTSVSSKIYTGYK